MDQIFNGQVANLIVNKYLFLHEVDKSEIETQSDDNFLARVIYHANLLDIKRLAYAIYNKSDSQKTLKP